MAKLTEQLAGVAFIAALCLTVANAGAGNTKSSGAMDAGCV